MEVGHFLTVYMCSFMGTNHTSMIVHTPAAFLQVWKHSGVVVFSDVVVVPLGRLEIPSEG